MYDSKQVENEISGFWERKRIFEKLIKRKGKSYFVLDGPPYANNIPHVGHIKNTVFKDLAIRIAFMKGFNVLFQPGFDTHGLPIENMVEKSLNLQSKKDIQKFGVDNFMKECRKNAALNKDVWMNVYKDLGAMYSLKEPYLTYEDYYIDSAWWAFSQMYKKGFVYEGEKSVMWCSHCETSLAGYEVTDSYKNINDPGIYVLFKLKNSDEHLLVYTTTPWTLPGNVAIAVNTNEAYSLIMIDGKKMFVAKKRLEKIKEIGKDYEVLKEINGKELLDRKYEPLLEIPVQNELGKNNKSHKVVASIPLLKERVASKVRAKKKTVSKDIFEDFVTMSEGTGMVHVAPGHGKTDFIVGQHYALPKVSPVNDRGELIHELTGFSGFVKKADREIMKKLQEEEKLFHHETINHSYPLCWRCKSPLIFRLSNEFFFKVDKLKEIMKRENKKVSWHPEFARERFENWVDNAEDWNISRNRYWGIPIPLWKCESCKEEIVVESKKQLEKLSGKKISDLHSSGNIVLKCKCGKKMEKVNKILDVWFDSGVAPWASLGYPSKNKQLFRKNFPVDRINEAQDQIRGWFYSLMFCSSGVFGRAPYKEVSMVGWVVDSKGNKMSKSVGNYISAEDSIKLLGADMLRYYLLWDVAPYEVQKFNSEIARKEIGKVLGVLWNLKNLAASGKPGKLGIEDRWILSRLESMKQEYQKNIDNFDVNIATRKISEFVLDSLSRNYVQMTREKENGKVVSMCLKEVLKLLAPTIPFLAEKIWQELKEKKIVKEESVHLCSWPKVEKKRIDKRLEEEMGQIKDIISAALMVRDENKRNLRWPYGKLILSTSSRDNVKIIKKFKGLVMEQVNAKEIVINKDKYRRVKVGWSKENVKFDTTVTEELEAEGYAREVSRAVQAFRKKLGLEKEDSIKLTIIADGELAKFLDMERDFIKQRTNSASVEIKSENVTTHKERFKNVSDFQVKNKRGKIFIGITTRK